MAPRPDPLGELQGGGITVAGPMSAATGLGEGARLCHAALARLGASPSAIDLAHWFGRSDLPREPMLEPGAGPGGALIVHLNAPHLPLGLALIGRRRIRHKRIVGYWAWELEVLPRAWRRGFRYVHEVWVPSEFVAGAVRRETRMPVRVVPHPVALPACSSMGRADFGLPADAFVVLAMFDMGSGYARKNPQGAIRAFREAFGEDSGALLLLKVAGAKREPSAWREIQSEAAGARNIRFLHDALSREDHGALLRCADAAISLHRSEGFGLVLAEAMRLGKPTVATGWSGNLQFMTAENSALVDYRLVPVHDPQGIYLEPDAVWAEPDVPHAAAWLRRLACDPLLRHRIGEAARLDAERQFGDDAYRRAIGDALTMDRREPAAPR